MNPSVKILIIDDEPLLRMNLRTLLEDLGYLVEEAPDGRMGLEACVRMRPDLVLLDIRMPVMDGFEVCARLKSEESTRGIPVMFLSGMMDTQDKVKAFQVGGVDYVTKPYHIEEVEARVRAHLELVRQRELLSSQNVMLQNSLHEMETLNRKLIEMNERLRQSEELKGQFLSNMRNEINNPMNAVLALGAELEGGEVAPDRLRRVGALIAAEAYGLDFQLRNIFCAAELEAGEAEPIITQVDVASVIRDAIEAMHHQALQKSLRVDLQAPRDPCELFRTDAEKLRIIVANLLSNAMKFGPEGSTIRLRFQAEGGELRIAVEDQGAGIRPEDQPLIFERFRQLETGSARAHGGQGLGLAVVKALVDSLNGQITVTSQPGRGSTFTCLLPEAASSDAMSTLSMDGNIFFFGEAEEA